MKVQEVIFKRPVKIIQVFRSIKIYGKANKSFDTRKEDLDWGDIQSKSGCIVDKELYLPEKILSNPDFKNCDLITIEDDNQPQAFTSTDLRFTKVIDSNIEYDYNHCFNLTNPGKLDIFEIKSFKGELELYLHYGYFEIGIPKRDNFKLCMIRRNEPVEVKINGKTDHSMSSGRERIFKDQQYIFNYIGDFNKCKILKQPYNSIIKHVPIERKVIDLIKQLW
jgi:hypothetical protein